MRTTSAGELREFHQFVGEKLSHGGADVSPEEALDEWRKDRPDSEALNDDIAAIQEALSDLGNGDTGISFDEFDREFRKRHNLPANP